MPVLGLTDRESLVPRFPRLGKLRKGGAKPERGFAKDLDWFRFTSDQSEVVKAFVEAYGEKPSRLEVYLPYATPDENFDTWMEEWSAGGLVHRCDGETATIHRKSDGTYDHNPIPCPYADGKVKRTDSNPGCRIVGRLAVILPDLLRAGFVGYVVLETHSNHDLRNIMATLLAVTEARPQGLQGIPFTLRRYKETISTPAENGKRVRREKSLVALVPAPTWVESRMALARAEAYATLPSGDTLLSTEANGDYESAEEYDDDVEYELGDLDMAQSQNPSDAVEPAPGNHNGALSKTVVPTVPLGKATRPLDPEQLRDFLHKKAAKIGNVGPATDKQIPFLASKFQEAFVDQGDASACYHSALKWIWHKTSAKELTLAEAGATLDWLLASEPDETGDIPLHEHAPEEAQRVLREAMVDAGQQDMFEKGTE